MISKESLYISILTEKTDFDLYHLPLASKSPEVSVILSTYNRFRQEGECKSLLKRALDSILNQSFKDFELILIDDCSTDNTQAYCKEIALNDSRVQFFHFKKNSGIPAKRYNFGISVSRGKYVTFMFDDDELELNALRDLHQSIEGHHKNCGMVYGLSTYYRGKDGKNIDTLGGKWGWNKINTFNFIANNAVIVKRSVIDLLGGYDEDPVFLRVCDWDLWWRIGRKFKIGRINVKVSNVFSELPDSIGNNKLLDLEAYKTRRKQHRLLPLKIIQKEPLRCKIQSAWFDLYVSCSQTILKISLKMNVRQRLKKILPWRVYLFLKK